MNNVAFFANVLCVIVAALLLSFHIKDPIVWLLSLGILYQHGVRPLCQSVPTIPWIYLKIFTGLGMVYALKKQYYAVALVMGYSCLSKFVPQFSDQIPLVIIMSLLVAVYACYFSRMDTKTNYNKTY